MSVGLGITLDIYEMLSGEQLCCKTTDIGRGEVKYEVFEHSGVTQYFLGLKFRFLRFHYYCFSLLTIDLFPIINCYLFLTIWKGRSPETTVLNTCSRRE